MAKKKKKQKIIVQLEQEQMVKVLPKVCDAILPNNKPTIKQYFFKRYGQRCWLCGQYFDKPDLTLHHVIPVSISHKTIAEESSIVCTHCHFDIINKISYNTREYWQLMDKMYANVQKWQEEEKEGSNEVNTNTEKEEEKG